MKTKQHTIYKLADGSRVPGVTTIVGMKAKPQLIDWANRIGLEGIVVSSMWTTRRPLAHWHTIWLSVI
jgi:hypothetical protein